VGKYGFLILQSSLFFLLGMLGLGFFVKGRLYILCLRVVGGTGETLRPYGGKQFFFASEDNFYHE
jgi:hypothetical protein